MRGRDSSSASSRRSRRSSYPTRLHKASRPKYSQRGLPCAGPHSRPVPSACSRYASCIPDQRRHGSPGRTRHLLSAQSRGEVGWQDRGVCPPLLACSPSPALTCEAVIRAETEEQLCSVQLSFPPAQCREHPSATTCQAEHYLGAGSV